MYLSTHLLLLLRGFLRHPLICRGLLAKSRDHEGQTRSWILCISNWLQMYRRPVCNWGKGRRKVVSTWRPEKCQFLTWAPLVTSTKEGQTPEGPSLCSQLLWRPMQEGPSSRPPCALYKILSQKPNKQKTQNKPKPNQTPTTITTKQHWAGDS